MKPLSLEVAVTLVSALRMLPFFPQSEMGETLLAEELLRMCEREEQADWLIRRVFQLWKKWEGPQELRAVYCSKFRPRDGIEVGSQLYPEGVPSQNAAREREITGGGSEPTPAQLAAWEKAFGPADPDFGRKLLASAARGKPQ